SAGRGRRPREGSRGPRRPFRAAFLSGTVERHVGAFEHNRPTLPTVVHHLGRLTPPFALLDLLHLGAVTLRKLLEELPGLLALQRGAAQAVPRVDEDVEVLDVVEVQPA